jgi:hypothetical protein
MSRGDAPLAGPGAEVDVSVGRYLARQRRLRGVSLDELASVTRIPRRSLERLEDGAFDRQSDGFARGFVRTVADALGLDAEEAVLRLIGEPTPGHDEPPNHRLAFFRWAVVSLAVLGGTAAIVGVWSLFAERAATPAREIPQDVFIRHDVVRELAAAQRAAYVRVEPLASGREGHRD